MEHRAPKLPPLLSWADRIICIPASMKNTHKPRRVSHRGWRSAPPPFKVRKMEQIKLGNTGPLHTARCHPARFKCTGLSGGGRGSGISGGLPLVSPGRTMGGMRSGSSSSPACSPVARNRLRSRKSGTSIAKSTQERVTVGRLTDDMFN